MRDCFFRGIAAVAVACMLAFVPAVANAETIEWEAFVIRNSNSGNVEPAITERASGKGVDTTIALGGQKTGYGTSAFDGMTLGSIVEVDYDRLDAGPRHPYVNIWVTDGLGHSAIIAPAITQNGGETVSSNPKGLDFQSLGVLVYETNFNDLSWLVSDAYRETVLPGKHGLVHNDASKTRVLMSELSHLIIGDIGAYPSPYVGSGAPKNGTGFNFIFGDTQTSFTGGYSIDNASVAVVPLPPAVFAGIALFGLVGVKRKFAKRKPV